MKITDSRFIATFGLLATFMATAQISAQTQVPSERTQVADVRPGRGIVGELELGMTIAEVTLRRPDFLIITNESAYYGTISALGASVHLRNERDPISLINFDVDPTVTSNLFRGTIGRLTFSKSQQVDRAQVYKMFGDLAKHRTTDPKAVRKRLLDREDVAWSNGEDLESLYYPDQGIMFNLRRGIVVRFAVISGPWAVRLPTHE
jgi:hypothetical protein